MSKAIKMLQRALKRRGARSPFSGRFDRGTQRAMQDWQRRRRLPVTTFPDSFTLFSLSVRQGEHSRIMRDSSMSANAMLRGLDGTLGDGDDEGSSWWPGDWGESSSEETHAEQARSEQRRAVEQARQQAAEDEGRTPMSTRAKVGWAAAGVGLGLLGIYGLSKVQLAP